MSENQATRRFRIEAYAMPGLAMGRSYFGLGGLPATTTQEISRFIRVEEDTHHYDPILYNALGDDNADW